MGRTLRYFFVYILLVSLTAVAFSNFTSNTFLTYNETYSVWVFNVGFYLKNFSERGDAWATLKSLGVVGTGLGSWTYLIYIFLVPLYYLCWLFGFVICLLSYIPLIFCDTLLTDLYNVVLPFYINFLQGFNSIFG